LALQHAGAIMIVLEAIPALLAEKITNELSTPTIGIGAGEKCSGQVLVIHDLIGLYDKFVPKFVKQYDSLWKNIESAVVNYCADVRGELFPAIEHSYSIDKEIINKL